MDAATVTITVHSVIDAIVDVKPGNGDECDPVNLGTSGVLPIVIYSGGVDNFDARAVDIDSIQLNGKAVRARHAVFKHIDRDGRLDLMVQFEMSDIRKQEVFDPNLFDAQIWELTAEIAGGTALGSDLIAEDWIRLVPPKGKK